MRFACFRRRRRRVILCMSVSGITLGEIAKYAAISDDFYYQRTEETLTLDSIDIHQPISLPDVQFVTFDDRRQTNTIRYETMSDIHRLIVR